MPPRLGCGDDHAEIVAIENDKYLQSMLFLYKSYRFQSIIKKDWWVEWGRAGGARKTRYNFLLIARRWGYLLLRWFVNTCLTWEWHGMIIATFVCIDLIATAPWCSVHQSWVGFKWREEELKPSIGVDRWTITNYGNWSGWPGSDRGSPFICRCETVWQIIEMSRVSEKFTGNYGGSRSDEWGWISALMEIRNEKLIMTCCCQIILLLQRYLLEAV